MQVSTRVPRELFCESEYTEEMKRNQTRNWACRRVLWDFPERVPTQGDTATLQCAGLANFHKEGRE